MFNTHEIIGKVVKDFIFGTGNKPSLDEFNQALSEIDRKHADGLSVNKAHSLWIRYYNEMAESLPLHRRFLYRLLDFPLSAKDELIGFLAFVVENGIQFDDDYVAKVDKRSELHKSLKLLDSINRNRKKRLANV